MSPIKGFLARDQIKGRAMSQVKGFLLPMILLFCVFVLTGCSSLTLNEYSQDIARMELVQAIGVDSKEEGIAVVAEVSDSEEGPKIISADGATVDGALEKLRNYSSKERIFLAHTKHYVLGEQAAAEGVGKYLDFIERDMNMRINTPMFIVRGSDSYELMSAAIDEGADIALILETFEKSLGLLSDGYVFTCADVAGNLQENGCALVAAIEMGKSDDAERNDAATVPAGYAILKDGKLLDYIDAELVGGANIFLKGMNPDVLEIEDKNGNSIAFRVGVDKLELQPVYQGERITGVTIDMSLKASVEEVGGVIDIYDDEVLGGLCRSISNKIKRLGDRVLGLSQDLKTDFLNLEKNIQIKSPIEYSHLARPWADAYPDIDFQLRVETQIERTYDLMEPVGVSGESDG